VSDATNQMSFVERKACNVPCPRSTAEWIVERPGPLGNPYPLGDYSPITFTDLQASGIGGKGIQYFMEHKNVTLSSCIASPPFPPRANALTCLWSASQ
jgi:Peptidase A4 family